MTRFGAILLCATVIVGLAAAPARAANPQADYHFDRGVKLYNAGDYNAAAREFAKAHKLEPKPDYLFAWAQAKRREGDCRTAQILFERFLQAAPTKVAAEAAKKAISDGCVEKPAEPSEAEADDGLRSPDPQDRKITVFDASGENGGGGPKKGPTIKKGVERPVPPLFAVAARVDLAPLNRGAMIAPGLAISLGKVELFGNALVGGLRGLEGGFRAMPVRVSKWFTPFVSASMPVLFAGGTRVCTRGSVGARVHLGSGWAITAEGGGSYNFNPPPTVRNPDGSVRQFGHATGLVSLGMEVWY